MMNLVFIEMIISAVAALAVSAMVISVLSLIKKMCRNFLRCAVSGS